MKNYRKQWVAADSCAVFRLNSYLAQPTISEATAKS